MYFMSAKEFQTYEVAERQLEHLRQVHAEEIEAAYDNIHPTRSCFDYDTGKIISESINPCDYAIYLLDMRKVHEKEENWWEERARIFKIAYESLTEKERQDWEEFRPSALFNKLRELLLQQIQTEIETFTDEENSANYERYIQENRALIEADKEIDKMSMKEIMKDYADFTAEPPKPEPKIRPIIPLDLKREQAISPVKEWIMSEEERVAYVTKHPIIKRSRKYYNQGYNANFG
jgi:uncharacterized protein (DUF952 family)